MHSIDIQKWQVRGRAIGHLEAGQSQLEVLQVLNIATSVVYRLWRCSQEEGDVHRCFGRGHPRVTANRAPGRPTSWTPGRTGQPQWGTCPRTWHWPRGHVYRATPCTDVCTSMVCMCGDPCSAFPWPWPTRDYGWCGAESTCHGQRNDGAVACSLVSHGSARKATPDVFDERFPACSHLEGAWQQVQTLQHPWMLPVWTWW